MKDKKIYMLVEFTVLPEHLDDVIRIFEEALPSIQKERGFEVLYLTSLEGEPTKFVFFEVFATEESRKFHLEQNHTKKMAAALDGKLTGAPVFTRLHNIAV